MFTCFILMFPIYLFLLLAVHLVTYPGSHVKFSVIGIFSVLFVLHFLLLHLDIWSFWVNFCIAWYKVRVQLHSLSFITWFIPQMTAVARGGPGQSPEPIIPSWSSNVCSRGPSTWVVFCCLPRLLGRKLNYKQNNWGMHWHS